MDMYVLLQYIAGYKLEGEIYITDTIFFWGDDRKGEAKTAR